MATALPRKPFREHLEEVRSRSIWVLLALLLGASIGYVIRIPLLTFLLKPLHQPVYYSSPTGGFDFVFKVCFFFGFLVLSFSFIIFFPSQTFAQTYGSGSYGSCSYNDTSSCLTPTPTSTSPVSSIVNSIATVFSQASAPTCGMPSPSSASQWLYAAVPQDSTSVKLYFTDAGGSYDHYVVEYGLSSGNYIFGLDNAGGKGTRTVTINLLLPNTTYYFRVRPGNGCAPGVWSNEISTKTKSILVQNTLTFNNTSIGITENQPQNLPTDKQQGIKITFPSNTTTKGKDSGYEVNVSVKDTKGQPMIGANVNLHSIPTTATTNKNGVATFHHIEQGQHKVIIAYANYQGEENINLSGKVKTFDVNVQVKPVNVLVSPVVLVIIGVLVAIILLLWFLLLRRNKRVS